MRLSAYIFAFSMVGGLAEAQTIVDQLCGQGHINETNEQQDVVSNPDGYFVHSLQEQISHGDPRIVHAVGQEFHLCTQSPATPEMDANQLFLIPDERGVKYLFVPKEGCPKPVS